MPHRLLSIRRRVPGSARSAYLDAWARLRAAATAAGANAWLFHSPGDPELHLEFIEWSAAADPLARPAVATELAALHSAFAGEEERWDEVRTHPEGSA